MSEQCQSYQDGFICKDGFVQKVFCRGKGGCYACGNLSDREKPFCLYDELPKHMANENGSPRFYKEQSND